jgi:hypothetical protein
MGGICCKQHIHASAWEPSPETVITGKLHWVVSSPRASAYINTAQRFSPNAPGVDASLALAWALPDESSAYADKVLAVVEAEGLRVPELWAREVANGLAVAYLRKQ